MSPSLRLYSLLVLVLCCLPDCLGGANCGEYHGQTKTFHTIKTGERLCCVQRRCPPGTRGEICEENEPETTGCVACEAESFAPSTAFSDDRLVCQPKQFCDYDEGETIVNNGSSNEDRTCGCDLSRGFYDPPSEPNYEWDFEQSHCYRKACEAGQELTPEGHCVICRPGYYKSETGYGQCLAMSHCMELTGRQAEFPGNSTHNNLCYNTSVTTVITPNSGGVKEADDDNVSLLYTVLGVIATVFFILIIVLLYVLRRFVCSPGKNSPSSSAERMSLGEPSYSDQEELDNKTNKAMKDLCVTIPAVPSAPPEYTVYPKPSITPDSGIFTDPCLMNGHLQQTIPSMLASEDLTIDAEPSHEDVEAGPSSSTRGQHPSRHKHPSAAGSEAAPSDSIAGKKEQGMTYLVIQNDGPVYLQCGNSNHMSASTDGVEEDAPSDNTDDAFSYAV